MTMPSPSGDLTAGAGFEPTAYGAAANASGVRPSDALQFLVEAGLALASSLDYETTLTNVVHQAVPRLADWCALDLLDDKGVLRRLAVAHPDPAKIDLARRLYEDYPEDPQSTVGTHARIRAGRTEMVENISDELLLGSAQSDEHARILRGLGLRSYVSAPLVRDNVALGALTFVFAESGRRYSHADVPLIEELARRAAVAIDHAQTHRRTLDVTAELEQQTVELELQAQQLQDQASEMEAQQSELEMQTAELQEAELFSRAIIDSIAEPMVVYDASWRARLVNAHALAAFDKIERSSALVGKTLWEAFPDLVGSGFEREMRLAAETRQPRTFVAYRAAAGSWSEVHCYPLPDGGIVAIWTDATARKRAEEALRYLSRASDIFASSLDYESRIAELAQIVVPDLADWCTVDLVDAEGALRQVAVAHVDPAKVEWARELHRKYPPAPSATSGVPNVIRTGQPSSTLSSRMRCWPRAPPTMSICASFARSVLCQPSSSRSPRADARWAP